MRPPRPLPPELGTVFSIADARSLGVGSDRLFRSDLTAPFRGVRLLRDTILRADATGHDDFETATRATRALALAYAERMRPTEFFSHLTAAELWGAPTPHVPGSPLDVAVFGNDPLPRCRGVRGHRADPRLTTTTTLNGLRVATPASVWASLGALPLEDLVVIGDYFCREWREGFLRPRAGQRPLTTRTKLTAALDAGRRVGSSRLRTALGMVREDSWSPRESLCRILLTTAGLPEPSLNLDVDGPVGFLACVDLAYPTYRVAIEYQGQHHGARYAKDIERIEALRAAGWIVIQVSSALLARPSDLVERVRKALISRGWRP
ncbi:hypothetical protein L1277_001684 [Okibacterium sp. HSC-33S16]|uniref:hypothetical protein n=1 Tax=Okibacterium sp. HSC-33S16 TaxID=2910965 RepID=UPI0020A100A4|nr:hypothetical protein [Okibacterium sp. HSC-33S16]MCP2031593.1 hypothetical protein [Okibacterium sp. HSC-33S16]